MRIQDLDRPVTRSKADWLSADGWIGFSPQGRKPDARAQCQATIMRQMAGGYVLEYITIGMEAPNGAYRHSAEHAAERKLHAERAGRLIAVHQLKASARPLQDILGEIAFNNLQDRWAKPGRRDRWSVAFPIVESFDIDERPLAKEVFSKEACQRIYSVQSSTLRVLTPNDQEAISGLMISRRQSRNEWIGVEDEIAQAERSDISPKMLGDISRDLHDGALEGWPDARRVQLRRRAAWLAERFARKRAAEGTLKCDHCGFDPVRVQAPVPFSARSIIDVHHTRPLEEGHRYTSAADLILLCPNCHRLEHALLRRSASLFGTSLSGRPVAH